jgi:SAM-dependent methyltransferase
MVFQTIYRGLYRALHGEVKTYTKWGIILLIVAVVYILVSLRKEFMIHKEGFEQREKYLLMNNDELYDEFYADIYDELFLQPMKLEYEVSKVSKLTKIGGKKENSNSNHRPMLLDVGSGRGHHVDQFQANGINVIGVDKSSAMVKTAKDLYPSSIFKEGDVNDPMLFPEDNFDVITCFTFTVYYMKDKRLFFDNCYKWLKPGGFLIVHLVDRNRFDPIVPAGKPMLLVSPQSVAEKRITNSLVRFNNFQYKADFKMPQKGSECQFNEVFKDDKSGKVRENNHTYYMPTRRVILDTAKEVGFSVTGTADLTDCMNEYQYLYFLMK